MEQQPNDRDARVPLARRVTSAGFLVPSVAVGTAIALVVSQYEPLIYDAAAAQPAQEAAASELTTVDTSDIEKTTAEPVAGASLDASDYGIDADNLKDGTYTGSGTGFRGTITVQVTISGGKITKIEVLSSADDPAYFNRAKGLISSVISAQSTSVDTVSGATYSSKGLLMAIKNALLKASGGLTGALGGDTAQLPDSNASANKPHNQLNPSETPEGGYKDGVYTGIGDGYRGDVLVAVTITDGKISKIEVKSHVDDQEYFSRAMGLIPSVIKRQTTGVDTVSGATYSSEGILAAIEDALSKAGAQKPDDPEPEQPENPDKVPGETDPETRQFEDGSYTASARCENEEDIEAFQAYYVELTVVIKDGKPVAIEDIQGTGTAADQDVALGEFDEENLDYLDYAIFGRTMRGQTYPGVVSQLIEDGKAPGNVDVVSRSTYSSRAIVAAYEKALDAAAKAYEDAHGTTEPDTGTDSGGQQGGNTGTTTPGGGSGSGQGSGSGHGTGTGTGSGGTSGTVDPSEDGDDQDSTGSGSTSDTSGQQGLVITDEDARRAGYDSLEDALAALGLSSRGGDAR